MYVLTYLDRGDDGNARVVRFGPTSESAGLLSGYSERQPICDAVAILPVLRGGLLRVSRTAANRALRRAMRDK